MVSSMFNQMFAKYTLRTGKFQPSLGMAIAYK